MRTEKVLIRLTERLYPATESGQGLVFRNEEPGALTYDDRTSSIAEEKSSTLGNGVRVSYP